MNTVIRLASFFAIGLGIVGLISLVDSWTTSRSYEDWKSTEGEITYSELVYGIGCGPGATMSSMVIYDFEVEGVSYSSSNISHGADNVNCGTYLVDTYPKGKKVTVYYDPENPKDSVLKLTEMNTVIAVIIGFLLLGMILCGYVGLRFMHKGDQ